MAYVRARGVVSREVVTGDEDKILTVITEELGKISVSAKGARRSGNRFAAGTQVFSYCDWVLYKGRSTYILNSCEIVSSFYEIREDLELLAHAAHMLDMIQDTTFENQPAKEPLTLLLYALHALRHKSKTPQLVSMVFSLKLAQIMGYTPYLSGCAHCRTIEIEDIFFSFDHCGFICEKCRDHSQNTIRIEPGTAKALIYVLCADVRDSFAFTLSPEVLKNFSDVVEKYINDRFERKYCKLSFWNQIQNNEMQK